MKRLIKVLLLVALMAVPWVTQAQCTDGTPCSFTIAGVDDYGDGWEGSLTIYRNNVQMSTFEVSGSSNTQTFTVCSGDLVRIDWSGNDQYYENTFTITGGDGTVYVSNAHGYTYAPSGTVVEFAACPSCFTPLNMVASGITSNSITISWMDTNASGSYSIDYWPNGGDTITVTTTDTFYTFSGLDANMLYHFAVKVICSATDESAPLRGNFATACGGSTCDLTISTSADYAWSYYYPTITLYQNGVNLGSAQGTTQTIQVCSTDTVQVVYTEPNYDWEPSATVIDGGGTTLFNGSTGSYSTGDVLLTIATPCPSCIPPTALFIDTVDQNNVTIGWTPRSGATLFAVYQDDSVVSESVTDTFYTFSGLSANTQYTFGVQSICTATDSSSIAHISTRTSCGAMNLPFFVDFEDAAYNGAWYPCWDSTIHAGTDPSVNDQPGGSYNPTQHTPGGTYAMYLQGNSSQNYNLVVGPEMNAVGNMINVSFWAMINNGWIKAGVITNPRDTSTFIPMVTITSGGWTEYEFNTSTLDATANYRIAWLACGSGYIGKFDDVSVSEFSGCDRPTTATVSNITAHTADLTWNAASSAIGYTVYYGTVNDATNPNLNALTTTDTTVTLTGLNGETHYYAWVVSNCSGSTESDFRPFNSFTTLVSCPGVTALTVDTTTSDGATIHWSHGGEETQWYIILDSNEIGLTTDTFYTVTGLDAMTGHTLYVRAYCADGDTSIANHINFATSCEDPTCNITFNMVDSYGDGWNGNYIQVYQVGIMVGQGTISSGSSATETVEVCSSAAVELRYVKGYYANEMQGTVTDGGGNIIFTISDMNGHATGDVLATVANPCPNCIMPSGFSVSNITSDGAILSWVAQDGQSNWIVRHDSVDHNVTDTFYTFTGLQPRTTYTVYVATDCSGDTSNFASFSFTTDCATGSCDITITSTADDVYSYYCPTVHVWQNGEEVTSVNAETKLVNVCSGLPVTLKYEAPYYGTYYNPSVVVLDGGDAELFNSSTSNYSTGDTLVYTPNACPSCLTPTGLRVTYIDSTELTFQWDYVDSVDAYIVSFNGDSNWTVADSVYGAFNLDPNTAYTFSVRAICVTGVDTSNARTITVKTACGQMALPYVETFEYDPQGTVPSCWTVVTPGYNGNPKIDGNAHTGNNSLGMHSDGYVPCMIASSAIPLNGDSIYVSFWAKNDDYYGGSFIEAGVMTNLAVDTTFIPMVTVPVSSDYARYEFNTSTLTAYYDSTFYLAFRYTNTGTYYGANIDDINITLYEGCMYPSNIAATPTAHNVALTWHNGGSTGDFAVQYRVYGTTEWDTNGFYSIDTNYNLNGLDAATTYEVRVGTICGLDTLWTMVTTQTLCDLINLPYIENFVSADGTLPPCWNYTDPSYFHWNRWTTHAETSGDGEMMAGSGSAGEYAILPEFNASLTKLQISFKAKLGNISEGDSMLFGVYDSYSDTVYRAGAMAIAGQSREGFVVFTYAYSYYAGLGNRIAIGHSHNNPSDWGFAVDSIVVIQLPDCLPPTDVEAHNTLYPNTADDIYFTWTGNDIALNYQLYIDTITSTVDIDSIPDSLLINVDTTYYHVPFNSLAYGAHYRFFVRSNCGYEQSNWVELQNGFTTDEVWMNNSNVADTVIGCDFVIYDNGGPVAGYLHNSNSALVLISGDIGRELQLQGGWFSHGADANTLTVYDGIGTSGDVLYSRSEINMTERIDSILATSTTGAMTITFTSGYYANLGYELYIHCVGTAPCERPTRVHAEMTEVGEATVSWQGSANSYNVYYKISSDSVWTVNTVSTNSLVLTGLVPDTNYDLYVVGDCDTNGTSTPSVTIHFISHFTIVIAPCDGVSDLTASNITTNSAMIQWVSDGVDWEMEISRIGAAPDTIAVTTNPYTLTNLLPSMEYSVRMRTVCDGPRVEPYSEWSASVSFTTETPGPGPQAINNVDGNCDLRLFPNPANATVTVSFTGIAGEATIEIVDISGKCVSSLRTLNSELKIDLSQFAAGAYFVRVTGEQATAVRRLIVK